MSKTEGVLKSLSETYEFKIEDDPNNKQIKFIIFDDGRKYKFQFPLFDAFHDAFTTEGHVDTALFKLGLTCLFPENDKSPKITDAWLNSNMLEGINLWSPLLRGLLFRPPT